MSFLPLIKKSVLFENCNEAALQKLASACKAVDLGPGQSLFFEGDAANALYLVKNGTIVIKKSAKSSEEDIAKIGSDSHFGEVTFLAYATTKGFDKRTASAEALEATQLLEIPFEALNSFLQDSPKDGMMFYRNLALNLSARIQKTAEDLSSLKALRLKHV